MTVPFDLYIQEELFFAASGELYDFVQCRDPGPGIFAAEEGAVIQISDLILGHFPDILVKACGPL